MATALKLKIGSKSYALKFGYGSYKLLSQFYGLTTYSQLGELITKLDFGSVDKDINFEQIDFIGNLVLAAIRSEEEIDFSADDIVDELLKEPKTIEKVLTAFTDSFPKDTKKKATTRKRKPAKT